MKEKLKNLFYIFFPLIVGGIVGFLTKDYIDYSSLDKPPLSPPKIIFPVMWSIIYLLMGISYYLYKRDYNVNNKVVRNSYYSQLFVNLLWTIIFFVLKLRFIAIIWILLLLIFVVNLFSVFKKFNKISAYLNIPYIIWVIFATYLTIGIYILNR